MNPIIGIVPSIEESEQQYFTNITNVNAIKKSGGIPIVLPYTDTEEMIEKYANLIDGLYLAGGNDIDPSYFNEAPHPELGEVNPKRDAFEWEILKRTTNKDKPVLGVCKGAQMINVFFGGGLYQDITSQVTSSTVQHAQIASLKHPIHNVVVVEETKLYDIIQQSNIKVNSHHHQAIRDVGSEIAVSGRTSDGMIESIESRVHHFVLGVQWHPEELLEAGNQASFNLYKAFIERCEKELS